jgi:hypothetical protein
MLGLVVMRWDERAGTEIVAKYPEEIEIPNESLMQLYSTHEYSREVGMISMVSGMISYASYYTGIETQVYIVAVLDHNDNADLYEDGLGDIAQTIVPLIDSVSNLTSMMPSLFQRLSMYPSMNWEQQLLILLEENSRRQVMKRLREEGSLIKSELGIWLKDQFQDGFFEVESLLRPFYNLGLIEGRTIKNMEYIFLVQDVDIHRRPNLRVLDNLSASGLPQSAHNQFLEEVKIFFTNYYPSEEDQMEVIKVLLDLQVFEVFKLLRIACVTKPQLEKLRKKGVDDIDGTIKKLWDARMISVLYDDKKNEYYALKTDVKITKIFGKSLMNVIKDQYEMKTKPKDILTNHLQILEGNYSKYIEEMKKVAVLLAQEEE